MVNGVNCNPIQRPDRPREMGWDADWGFSFPCPYKEHVFATCQGMSSGMFLHEKSLFFFDLSGVLMGGRHSFFDKNQDFS